MAYRKEIEREIWKTYHPDYRSSSGRYGVLVWREGRGTTILYLDTLSHDEIMALRKERCK